jgi:nicotinate-nucleotide adenylyltransferase
VIKNVGILGGAFDPPHVAHVALAHRAIAQFDLDVLHVVPTGKAWHKSRDLSDAKHRVVMAQLAFLMSSPEGLYSDKIRIDDREAQRSGPSYTIDTVKEIELLYPKAKLFLIIGQDQALAFEQWREPDQIVKKAQIVIASRRVSPHTDDQSNLSPARPPSLQGAIDLNCPLMPISATEVRAFIHQGLDVSQLVPELVLHYIQQQGLYANTT